MILKKAEKTNSSQHKSSQEHSYTVLVKNNILNLQSGDPSLVFENLFTTSQNNNKLHYPPVTLIISDILSTHEISQIQKHFKTGKIGKAMEIINDNKLPLHTLKTDDELHDTGRKYFNDIPKTLSPNIQQWSSQAPPLITYDNISNGINQLKINASDITGWSASLIKQIFSCGHDIKLKILAVLNKIASNQIPPKTSKFLTATVLTLLSKPNKQVRQISVG